MNRTQKLYERAKKIIPGGTQLLSKRPEMFLPGIWPAYYGKAQGCYVWDLDGNKYTDMSSMGIGACILGYADKHVNNAVKSAIDSANMTTLNPPEEIKLAQKLVDLHPWAEMVRFARSGGEAMSIAVRIGRAFTKRDVVLFCGYHGWHDWYLAANLSCDNALDGHLLPGLNPLGVPRKLRGTAYPFKYNDTKSFLGLVTKFKNKIGTIVIEPMRHEYPKTDFLEAIISIAKKQRIVLIVDEITSGFRFNGKGIHLRFNVEPDIAVFAKGMSNGFPMSAIIGKRKVMEIAQDTFISSTYWTERIGPVAALETIHRIEIDNVPAHLHKVGKSVHDGWRALAKKHDLNIAVNGTYPLGHFSFVHAVPLVLKTLFTQYMLERKFLAVNAFYASYAHRAKQIEEYLTAVGDAFSLISKAIKSGKPEKYLKTSVCHSGFTRLT